MTHATPTQSQRLKALGFDKPTRDYYVGTIIMKTTDFSNWNYRNINGMKTSAPTPSEVLDWFREKKGIDAWVESIFDFDNEKKYIFIIHGFDDSRTRFSTHPEATSALIDKLIEIEEQKA